MPAGKLDITLEQGSTFRRTFTVRENGAAKDLTGYGIASKVRTKPSDSSALLTFSVSATNLAGGEFQLYALTAATFALPTYDPPARLVGYWDLELTAPDGAVTRLVEGRATVSPEITK